MEREGERGGRDGGKERREERGEGGRQMVVWGEVNTG